MTAAHSQRHPVPRHGISTSRKGLSYINARKFHSAVAACLSADKAGSKNELIKSGMTIQDFNIYVLRSCTYHLNPAIN